MPVNDMLNLGMQYEKGVADILRSHVPAPHPATDPHVSNPTSNPHVNDQAYNPYSRNQSLAQGVPRQQHAYSTANSQQAEDNRHTSDVIASVQKFFSAGQANSKASMPSIQARV